MSMKDKWINEVMDSLDGIQPAEANPFLYSKILNKLNKINDEYAPTKLVWLSVASFAVLLILNIQTIKTIDSSSKNEKNELQNLASNFQLLNTNSFNYNQ